MIDNLTMTPLLCSILGLSLHAKPRLLKSGVHGLFYRQAVDWQIHLGGLSLAITVAVIELVHEVATFTMIYL